MGHVTAAARTAPASSTRRRAAIWLGLLAIVAGLVYLMATASTGPIDPTEATAPESRATIVFNSGIIVFREGLEAVLIFAAVTASFLGANKRRRRPVVAGAACAFAAAVATWFIAQAVLDAASSLGPKLEAITGFLAIVVLLIVLNWFVHKVYWSDWIGRHHRQRRKLLAKTGAAATIGLVALGFTSVYREGFEVVLFLQSLQLKAGTSAVLEGVGLGLAGTAVVGVITFWLHHRLPYRRMLVLTGVLVGAVLVVMIGGTALSFQDLGWIPRHPTPFTLPQWMGAWFEMYSTWETLAAQLFAAVFVIGSYYVAQEVKVNRPRRQGAQPLAERASAPPPVAQRLPSPPPRVPVGAGGVAVGRSAA
jgi:high-affinity iron transporter